MNYHCGLTTKVFVHARKAPGVPVFSLKDDSFCECI